MWFNQRKHKLTEDKDANTPYKGVVQFVLDDRIFVGEIFGKPFRKEPFGHYYYYIRRGAKHGVIEVPAYAIEELTQ